VVFAYGSSLLLRMRLVVDVPRDLPFQYVIRNLPSMTPRREEHAGHVRWIFEAGPIDAPELQDWAPFDVFQLPSVTFSTGASWSDIARRYSDLVDAQIQASDASLLPAVAVPPGATPRETAALLLERLQRDVRYTSVAFGDAAIVPRRPAEVLARGFGDCKDQASLLVAMLRARGIAAHVALLSTTGSDLSPSLPALGVFDHAIAVIPGSPPLWIDPTDRGSRVGELPLPDQGRLALIAAPGTTALVRVPEMSAADNRQVRTHEWFLGDLGPGRVVETTKLWPLPSTPKRMSWKAPEEGRSSVSACAIAHWKSTSHMVGASVL